MYHIALLTFELKYKTYEVIPGLVSKKSVNWLVECALKYIRSSFITY
jgi:hypothetical protein